MARYEATVTRTYEMVLNFEDDDLEGETPEIAASELSFSYPSSEWEEVYEDIVVTKLGD